MVFVQPLCNCMHQHLCRMCRAALAAVLPYPSKVTQITRKGQRTHTHTCTHTHSSTCAHTHTHTHTYTQVHVHTHTHTHTSTCAHTHTHTQYRGALHLIPTSVLLCREPLCLQGVSSARRQQGAGQRPWCGARYPSNLPEPLCGGDSGGWGRTADCQDSRAQGWVPSCFAPVCGVKVSVTSHFVPLWG